MCQITGRHGSEKSRIQDLFMHCRFKLHPLKHLLSLSFEMLMKVCNKLKVLLKFNHES